MVKATVNMKSWFIFVTAFLALQCAESAILVPEEVPTLSSIIYSLLPPVKLGQDSRFGFGFRLGRNADAQFLIELGPQQATEPLGNESKKRELSNKSQNSLTLAEREKFLRQLMYKIQSSILVESTSQGNTATNNTTDYRK